MADLDPFIRRMPKAELHMHLEGCIEPATMFTLAERNGVELPWPSPQALARAYRFDSLQSFLDLYFQGCQVLRQGVDFFQVTREYLARAHADGVIHAEIFLGPQSFLDQGVPLGDIIDGVLSAFADAALACAMSGGLIVSTHRHRSEAEAFALLDALMPFRERILGIGMGGAEIAHPPAKFTRYFAECRRRGFRTCIHAGEEGPADYVRQAFEALRVDRIDHGIACMDDAALVARLAAARVPLTVCPVSNVKLKVVETLEDHPLRRMLAAGLNVSVHSDDPPYFGAYVADNLVQCRDALGLTRDEVVTLARNSLASSFAPPAVMASHLARLASFIGREDG